MFSEVFPGWSNSGVLTGIVVLRVVFNGSLVAVTAGAAGVSTPLTAVAASLTAVIAVITVSALRPGGVGHGASYFELLLQIALVLLAGYAVVSNPSTVLLLAAVPALLGALVLGAAMVPIYGEAFVAP